MHTAAQKTTVVKSLIANPAAIPNDAIRVWVQASPLPEGFNDGLDEWLASLPPRVELSEVVPLLHHLELRPGQLVLRLQALGRSTLGWRSTMPVDLIQLPHIPRLLELPNGNYLVGTLVCTYAGAYLGDCRPLRPAANRR